ncbi:MAG: hypothetical protein AB8I08_20545 [Sandaracinaceae bacterium]
MRRFVPALMLLALACDPSPMVPDTGTPRDASLPPRDTGTPPRDTGTPSDSGNPPSGSFCDALDAFMTRCGSDVTACDGTLQTNCDAIVEQLDPDFVSAVDTCLANDNPTNCFFQALDGLSPSTAQRDFGDAFCAGCRSDDASCSTQFFTGGEAASALARAVDDDAAGQFEERCASGVLCGDRVGECAGETLALLGLPAGAATCFVETLLAENELPLDCGGEMPDGGMPDGGPVDGGPVDGGPVDGGPVDGGGVPARCTSFEPNENASGARAIGAINDRRAFPAGNVSSGISNGDEDWFSYTVEDVTGGLIRPRVDLVTEAPGSENLQLCAFYECDSEGDSTISCREGEEATLGGLDGCCSENASGTEMVELSPNCTSFNESGTVFVRVFPEGAVSACQPYFIAWGDD